LDRALLRMRSDLPVVKVDNLLSRTLLAAKPLAR